jgi:hypothetical protein
MGFDSPCIHVSVVVSQTHVLMSDALPLSCVPLSCSLASVFDCYNTIDEICCGWMNDIVYYCHVEVWVGVTLHF